MIDRARKDRRAEMRDVEIADSGTIRKLNLTHMALILALKIVDGSDQAELDGADLDTLRVELGMERQGEGK